MPTSGYPTLEELKLLVNSPGGGQDGNLTRALNAAISGVERHCHRKFTADAAATARVYVPTDDTCITVHDIADTAGLLVKTDTNADGVYETTISSSNYQLEPLNGLFDGQSVPYTEIHLLGTTSTFPITWDGRATVQVTAVWGWPGGVPADVAEGVLLLAADLFKRKDVPAGGDIDGVLAQVQVPGGRSLHRLLEWYRLTGPGLGVA